MEVTSSARETTPTETETSAVVDEDDDNNNSGSNDDDGGVGVYFGEYCVYCVVSLES